ncbi:ABC transporter substrate-binding protein [Ketogulonicigenium vulgare]|uniref:Glycosyl transferase, family 4 n=1 Tax=Ketogulonicigenium vulgare (strain WSH-001) TaxID=759362 RepID=F9Y5L2_KETVW|nr:ABC transporter substrate-binding protein [Ketogulonicigenium vulgare]AEM40765.1 Glycosyl transferase, family 4 [Ketogulonicigenium vulgare WSH-001]ALJ82306.1 glycosyl transferase [Ketogulonicigenium vulgare]
MAVLSNWRKALLATVFTGAALASSAVLAETLNVMQSEGPRSMDPGDQSATYTNALLAPVYEGLLARTSDLSLAPALATEWTIDETGTIYTFKLREGVVFHDDTPFNAEAVVYNFERHLSTERGLAASGRIRTILAGIEALDDYTVQFTLKSPYPAFLNILTTNGAMIVSPTADAAGTVGAFSVGTGPYELVEYKSGEFVAQTKFDGYWGDNAASVDDIRWTWTSEPSVLAMALQTGDADVINPAPAAFAQVIQANPDLNLSVTDGSAVFWVALNTESEELKDVRVRQALNFATDRDGLVQAITNGYADPANSPLARIAEGYNPDLNPYPLDLDKARELLAEAGFPNGFTMSVVVQEQESRIAEALQAMWAQVGVTLDVRRMESGVWSAAAFADAAQKATEGTDAVIASWSSGVNGPDLQFRPLYHSASAAPTSANLGFYNNPEFDRLLDEAAAMTDETARNEVYGQLQEIVNEDAPMVLLYVLKDLVGYRDGVEGVWTVPGGMVRVDTAIKN